MRTLLIIGASILIAAGLFLYLRAKNRKQDAADAGQVKAQGGGGPGEETPP